MSRIRLLDCSKLALNQKNDNDVLICWHNVIVNFFDVLFLLSGWVIGPGFMSISSLLLELWHFFLRDWPEIWKFEIGLRLIVFFKSYINFISQFFPLFYHTWHYSLICAMLFHLCHHFFLLFCFSVCWI